MSGDIRLHFVGVLALSAAVLLIVHDQDQQQRDLDRLEQRITQLETPRAVPSRADRTRPQTPALRPSLVRERGGDDSGDRNRHPVAQRGLNWHALAMCESSGNPRAISPTGKYRGLVQFSLRSWHYVGMTGDPIDYPASVQLDAARRLYAKQGAGAWPACGHHLKERP